MDIKEYELISHRVKAFRWDPEDGLIDVPEGEWSVRINMKGQPMRAILRMADGRTASVTPGNYMVFAGTKIYSSEAEDFEAHYADAG